MSSLVKPPTANPASPPQTREPGTARSKPGFFRRSFGLIIFAGILCVAGLVGWLVWGGKKNEAFNGPVWTAAKDKLVLSIVERGTLESAENSEIVCRVKASSKGSTISTTIKWIIDDGTQVAKGEKILDLDDSGLQDQLKSQTNIVSTAQSLWIQADQFYLIVKSQNFSEIETAKIALVLAEIDLKKFLGDRIAPKILAIQERPALQAFLAKGLSSILHADPKAKDAVVSEYLQTLSDIEGRIEIARSDKEQWLDRASWSMRMVKKGYLSRSQADSDKSRLDSAEIALKKVQSELDIFIQFDVEKKVTEVWSKIKESERALDRTLTQAKSKEVQAVADRDSKKLVYLQEDSKRRDIEDEIRHCTVYSPQEGMVVFFVPEQSRMMSGGQQSIVAQGEPVREGQKLMRVPNLNRMLVNTRVHEAMVSRIKGEVTKPTGFSEALVAAFAAQRGPLELAVTYQVFFDNCKEQFRERDISMVYAGQRAFAKIDAFPNKVYQAHVKTVATVASQADYFTSDVKVYQTMVSIDGLVEGLKPGMSAEVTIVADETSEPVLIIPIQSVLGSVASGANRKVYVLDELGQPSKRDVTVGRSNDKMVEVLKGLEVGERLVLNPRSLEGEKSDLKAGKVGQQRGVDIEEIKTKKGGKKGPDGPPSQMPSPSPSPRVDDGKKNGVRTEISATKPS